VSRRVAPDHRAAPTTPEPALFEILELIASVTAAASPYLPVFPSPRPDPVPACILCSLVTRAVTRGIRALFAEFVNDPESRLRIRSAHGFCREHTRLVASTGDVLGVAILYADLADQTVERWQRDAASPASSRWLGSRSRTAPCPACDLETEGDSRYCGALAAGLGEEAVWNGLEESAILCAAHVGKVAALAKREHAGKLLSLEAEKLHKLSEDLHETIRKHDYRYRNEEWGPERDAWLRALDRLTKP